MHPTIKILSLLSIISLTLGSFTGCGEKRVHVSTLSGEPGEEMALVPTDENSQAQVSGLGNESVDESDLSSQIPVEEAVSPEPVESGMGNEPINMAHEPTANPITTELTDSANSTDDSLEPLNDSSLPPLDLDEGQGFLAQSGSSAEDHPNGSNVENFREPTEQDSSAELQDTLSGEGIEPIPETFQLAKADPRDSRQDQLNRIKEESAAQAAQLEDVFFQFDSWTLTPEGKQALERTRAWFEQDPNSDLIIEGHADQRGTQAYNMVLGKRRATAVREYLSQLGVAPSRLAIISYGKDKPFCQDDTEACYQLNRRGHLLVKSP